MSPIDMLKALRNKITHKYLPAIDHLGPTWAPSIFSDTRRKKFSDIADLQLKGVPEYRFADLEPISRQLLLMIQDGLDFLKQIDFVQSCAETIEFMKAEESPTRTERVRKPSVVKGRLLGYQHFSVDVHSFIREKAPRWLQNLIDVLRRS